MKILELRQKTEAELQKMVSENRKKMGQFRLDLASGKVKDIREIRNIKKDIARILTIIKEQKKTEGK
ncbi:MAG: 50S ribosomal protein L29 [Candidatus Nealsonbacteria bacterium CG_4_10_14_0_2_um_filter_38_17]|uniref:Large ribosomal subunit protein uL29 n=2 Tax=Candidatus Nealsoniibacteriota TaxID=1817911 RepID=A0A2M7UY14_9BACT|nr:MAG: 50S ribosomal protein L29 [Candidatus Nealsonbacteria bacterium CG23_combo_of_CG06-09_8_20_14_all_38_19]PIZ88864.1 MAG: 50S ribosomal protein L29 [Candidatus Nealsonbacteria bacterium CG_4_10_14_0_2_um_filter_38_17]